MIATSEELLARTTQEFPRFAGATLTPIEKGGSDRRFYRIATPEGDSLVLTQYAPERLENRHYVEIARFLSEHEIRAPKILLHDAQAHLIWIEDLGERDLWSYRHESWAVRFPLYQSALRQADKLHALPASAAEEIRPHLAPPFDAALYLWEQKYFFENCLGGYFGLAEKLRAELSEASALKEIAARLAKRTRVLIHRDFQSQNIIIRQEQAHLIDFQGMRLGLAEYDLASILYDPYVTLLPNERLQLLGEAEAETLQLCAMQRLMQALGFYGFAATVKGNRTFLCHIPAAMESLATVLREISGLERLQETLLGLNADAVITVREGNQL